MPHPHPMPPYPPYCPPRDPFRVFYMLTGVSFCAFISGFSACLFDLNQISECVDYAEEAVGILHQAGDHIVMWFISLLQEVFSRYPINI